MSILKYSNDDQLIESLDRISKPLIIITTDHARRIISAILRKISNLFEDSVIRFYKAETADESNILTLFSHSGRNFQASGEISTFAVDEVKTKGSLSWCVETGQPLWIENIRATKDHTTLLNRITNEFLDEKYTDFNFDPDSLIATPIKTRDGKVVSVLSIQISESGIFNEHFLDIVQKISTGLSKIMRKNSEYENNRNNTNDFVENFLDDILNLEFRSLKHSREIKTGFFARPFNDKFNDTAKIIKEKFQTRGVQLKEYDPDVKGGIIITEIVEQIKDAHFGIADITSNNPNVMMEVGLMISRGYDLLLLKNSSDEEKVSFNVAGYHVHRYDITGPNQQVSVFYPHENQKKDIIQLIESFITRVSESNPEFRNANSLLSDNA